MIEYSVQIAGNPEDANAVLGAELLQRGLLLKHTYQTLGAMAKRDPCPCPYHGVEQCDCHFSALLVYPPGKSVPPTGLPCVITLHQRAGAAWLYLLPSPWSDDDAPSCNEHLKDALEAAASYDGQWGDT